MRIRKLMLSIFAMLLRAFAVICVFFPSASEAAPQPALALYDPRRNEVLSTTEWRNVSLGSHSSFYPGDDPAHIYALQATIVFTNYEKNGDDGTKVTNSLMIVPYCRTPNSSAGASHADKCSMPNYGGTVLLRFRGGWEKQYAVSLWQDATLDATKKKILRSFRGVVGDEGVFFPFDMGSKWPPHPPHRLTIPRHKMVATCVDLLDECYQMQHFTYTESYKDIPLQEFSGRMEFPLGLPTTWHMPWTLRLGATVPHDSSSEVEVIVVLRTRREDISFRLWLTTTLLGNTLLFTTSLLMFFSFLAGTKELGLRLSSSAPLPENYRTVLYDDGDPGELRSATLVRVLLAVRVTVEDLFSGLVQLLRTCLSSSHRRRFRLDGGEDVQITSGDVEEPGGPVDEGTSGIACDTVNGDGGGGEEEEESDLVCRICRCSSPVEDLFSPCICNGTSKYVHRQCLERWRATTTNEEHRRVCAECKTPYSFVLERNPASKYGPVQSYVCIPMCTTALSMIINIILNILVLWLGGYYLKFCMYVATGGDTGVMWSCAHLYHWILGYYFVVGLMINVCAMEFVLLEFRQVGLQLLFILISLGAIEIPLNYVGQILLSIFFNNTVTLEVSYGVGIITSIFFYLQVLPSFYRYMLSLTASRLVVASRAGSGRGGDGDGIV
uniref:RING-CH-type domain-containing protein n=1 Tax=Trypanosoma congolense (strain IL3000) TaxID=1068625 RepID=G0UJP1_TRYCI|nr:conserved hypothetical protein [Trypanosoma congolense IL3000]